VLELRCALKVAPGSCRFIHCIEVNVLSAAMLTELWAG
jgi:hypothetical protein